MADPNFYATLEEATFRLNGTIVEFEGSPHYVNRVEHHADGIIRIRLNSIPYPLDGKTPPTFSRKIDDPGFRRFQTVGLGWCNHFNNGIRHASFLERVPARRSKQGLDSGSYRSFIPIPGRDGQKLATGVRFADLYYSEGFKECVENKYPALGDALEMLTEDSSIAISRDFLVKKTSGGINQLWYKKDICGIIIKGRVFLLDKFAFLKELIENNPNLTKDVEIGV